MKTIDNALEIGTPTARAAAAARLAAIQARGLRANYPDGCSTCGDPDFDGCMHCNGGVYGRNKHRLNPTTK